MTLTAPVEAEFRAIGTRHRILATDEAALPVAVELAQAHLAALDHAASRFRADSEVMLIAERAATGPVWSFTSRLLADYLRAALRAAALTDGLVDPTVGSAVAASGYDADIEVVRSRPVPSSPYAVQTPVPGWRSIAFDAATDRIFTPQGTIVDLGATAKAHAADTIAALLHERLPGGFLVNLGGDIAVSGDLPDGGWRIGIEDVDRRVLQVVVSTGQAVTTSSTRHRVWAGGDGTVRHHIVDPRTGRTAPTTWAQVSCVAANALEANAASTASIVLGPDAPAWLERHGIPARLDGTDGSVTFTAGWPTPTTTTPTTPTTESAPA